jgi:hypothetical protein
MKPASAVTLDCVTTAAIEGPADQISFQAVLIATPRREHARATTAHTHPDARKPVKEAPQNVTACFNARKGKGAPKSRLSFRSEVNHAWRHSGGSRRCCSCLST